ncbi:hypothetical protein GF382_00065 [Candidatus Falkowbacteria bacterium]|nr:hypothetical protein [Candidatus Falkowbacteria bacterium]
MPDKKNLLELLLEHEVISEGQADEVKNISSAKKKSVEDVLVEEDIMSIEEIVRFKARIYNIPYQYIEGGKVKEDALNAIPFEVAKNYGIACFDKSDNKIKVGMIDPYNSKAIEAVNFLVKEQGLEAEFYLISEDSLKKIFERYGNLEKEISSALETRAQEEGREDISEEKTEEISGPSEDVAGAPVARIVSVIIRHAVEENASDIHIEPMQKETRVRYRVDGILKTSLVLPKSIHNSVVGRVKVLARMKIDETRIPQDGRIRLIINKNEIDFRVSTMPLMGSEKVAMRILNLGKGIPKLEDLGFSSKVLRVVNKNIRKTFGLLLSTGPTGSGKSTTLASILSMLNKEQVNIVTLEDPIEYYIKGINQSQIKPNIDYTFANGLRSILRQDPDVIMVGEIRDNETAELCINAGLTGHFVISTLHTNSALDAIPRLLDMRVEPFLLGSTLNTVIAQRLARKICPNCKTEIKISPELLSVVEEELQGVPKELLDERLRELGGFDINDMKKAVFYEGTGCSHCSNTGYSGRTAIVEIIDINDEIKEIIMDSKRRLKKSDIEESQGFITMKQDGIVKCLQGITTIQEVLRVIQE